MKRARRTFAIVAAKTKASADSKARPVAERARSKPTEAASTPEQFDLALVAPSLVDKYGTKDDNADASDLGSIRIRLWSRGHDEAAGLLLALERYLIRYQITREDLRAADIALEASLAKRAGKAKRGRRPSRERQCLLAIVSLVDDMRAEKYDERIIVDHALQSVANVLWPKIDPAKLGSVDRSTIAAKSSLQFANNALSAFGVNTKNLYSNAKSQAASRRHRAKRRPVEPPG